MELEHLGTLLPQAHCSRATAVLDLAITGRKSAGPENDMRKENQLIEN